MKYSKSILKQDRKAIKYNEGLALLFKNSYRIIPLNIVISLFLSMFLLYYKVPFFIVSSWLFAIIVVSLIRLFYCKYILKNKLFNRAKLFSLKFFNSLTLVLGIIWVSIYFLSLPYLEELHEYIVMLVFGGISAGAIASLSVSLSSYCYFMLPMFIPSIIYNYSIGDISHAVIATMFFFLMITILIQSRDHESLLRNTFRLSREKEFLVKKLEEISVTDPLTGLYNRRYFNKILRQEYNRSKRNKYSFVIISLDIDNFKLINDNLGHMYGDKFLIHTANLLKHYTRRSSDICLRVGGDEFIIILGNTPTKKVKYLCEEIKNNFGIKNIKGISGIIDDIIYNNVLEKVSLSMGVVYVPFKSTASLEDILLKADQLLYKSKNTGKNSITYYNFK